MWRCKTHTSQLPSEQPQRQCVLFIRNVPEILPTLPSIPTSSTEQKEQFKDETLVATGASKSQVTSCMMKLDHNYDNYALDHSVTSDTIHSDNPCQKHHCKHSFNHYKKHIKKNI